MCVFAALFWGLVATWLIGEECEEWEVLCFFFPLDGKDVEGGVWEEDKAPKFMILKIMCYLKS